MPKHPRGQHRLNCTFINANLRGTCPHYVPGHYGLECRGFDQGTTTFGNLTIYHCRHDPPKCAQVYLPSP